MELNENSSLDHNKTTAIVSYLTIIGWFIAYFVMHKERKTDFSSYHLRQSLLLMIVSFASVWLATLLVNIMIGITGVGSFLTLTYVVQLGVFVLWLIGFIGALKGHKREIPLIGNLAQRVFANI